MGPKCFNIMCNFYCNVEMNCDIKRRGKMNVELMVIFIFTVKVVKSCKALKGEKG